MDSESSARLTSLKGIVEAESSIWLGVILLL